MVAVGAVVATVLTGVGLGRRQLSTQEIVNLALIELSEDMRAAQTDLMLYGASAIDSRGRHIPYLKVFNPPDRQWFNLR